MNKVLSDSEKKIQADAIAFAKKHKKAIAKRLTDVAVYLPESDPVSVFMAGSPGAGKTESAKELVKNLEKEGDKILRIDPDELRAEFLSYTGENSYLFQSAISILVEKIHDFALKNKQSFLLDGTLSSFGVAEKNIQRSLDKKRWVQILYVYQDPFHSWEFVKARELQEGRKILKKDFINQYFAARDVVNKLKLQFGNQIRIDLLFKNRDSKRVYKVNIDVIDYHIPETYTPASLNTLTD